MNAQPWTKADLRQMAAKGDRMAATLLMLWERLDAPLPRVTGGGMELFGPGLFGPETKRAFPPEMDAALQKLQKDVRRRRAPIEALPRQRGLVLDDGSEIIEMEPGTATENKVKPMELREEKRGEE